MFKKVTSNKAGKMLRPDLLGRRGPTSQNTAKRPRAQGHIQHKHQHISVSLQRFHLEIQALLWITMIRILH
ncbi:hypothetical protein L211DRAFT_835275 [Terfezia boudieri ATCC MYA-4762]|uniref:Uncharacterized protein n=1 Tax=Terfezia boudieri ATCC MYA-4762 TaxID=1051890 RepID=A0A3N4LU61_9PEZI|nr:hypothetical protein L211DRAFT_835275 [Terfezia boudieri ATCC MYA-4762]